MTGARAKTEEELLIKWTLVNELVRDIWKETAETLEFCRDLVLEILVESFFRKGVSTGSDTGK